MQLDFLPWLTIRHTSERREGQLYVPALNWALLVAVIALVVGFGSAGSLASAYGVAVTGNFVLTSVIFLTVARVRWGAPMWAILLGALGFLALELAFLAASLTKIVHGAWAPLLIALTAFVVLGTWRRGRQLAGESRSRREGPLRDFVRQVQAAQPPLERVPGTAVFLNANPETTPLALRANLEHNHVLHERVIVLSVRTLRVARVAAGKRLEVDNLADAELGLIRVKARVGFHDDPNVPALLRAASEASNPELTLDLDQVSYFVSRVELVRGSAPGMAGWRKRLYILVSRNAASPVAYFHLPEDRTISIGELIEI